MFIDRLLGFVKSSEIREFLIELDDYYNLDITFSKPTTSSGNFHKKKHNEKNGNFYHTLECLHIAKRLQILLEGLGIVKEDEFDIVFAALIMHDAFKYHNAQGIITPKTTYEHAWVSYKMITEFASLKNLNQEFIPKIAEAVRFHSSLWCHNDEEKKLMLERSKEIPVLLTMICDMISSIPDIDYGNS